MKNYKITVNGKTYDVSVEEAGAAPVAQADPAQAAAPKASASAGAATVKAPMPGTILDIKVAAGSTVKKGDVLCIRYVNGPVPRTADPCVLLMDGKGPETALFTALIKKRARFIRGAVVHKNEPCPRVCLTEKARKEILYIFFAVINGDDYVQ